MHLKAGNVSGAMQQWEKLRIMWPLWANSLREVDQWLAFSSLENMGVALVSRCYIRGQYQQAVELANDFLAKGLENPYTAGGLNCYLGMCLGEMGDYSAALEAYRQARKFYEKAAPERGAAMQYQVILLCYRLGNSREMRMEQEKMLAQFGDSKYAKLLREGRLSLTTYP